MKFCILHCVECPEAPYQYMSTACIQIPKRPRQSISYHDCISILFLQEFIKFECWTDLIQKIDIMSAGKNHGIYISYFIIMFFMLCFVYMLYCAMMRAVLHCAVL